jgi:hypothetical protein
LPLAFFSPFRRRALVWWCGLILTSAVYAPSKAALDYLPAPACALADRAPHHQALALNEICVLAAIAAAGGRCHPITPVLLAAAQALVRSRCVLTAIFITT